MTSDEESMLERVPGPEGSAMMVGVLMVKSPVRMLLRWKP